MITQSSFQAPWWLRNRHLQTIWPTLLRRRPVIPLNWERLELDDGDFIDLSWTGEKDGPLVLFIHGLEGNLRSHYATGMMQALHRAGLQTVFMHLRGCSNEPNRLPRRYHSGETGDPTRVITHIQDRYPQRTLYGLGVSAGGNILLKLMGERGAACQIKRAMAISVPFELGISSETMSHGLARIYQQYLLRSLKKHLRAMDPTKVGTTFSLKAGLASRNFIEFDDAVTAPMFGFRNAADYYQQSSSRQYLTAIRAPTLIVQSLDDPFMSAALLPTATEIPDCVNLELARNGGHVGFVTGRYPWAPQYWLDQRAVSFFTAGM